MDSFEQSEEALFEKCLELPRHERESFLDKACGDNAELKEAVLGLLRAHDTPQGFLEYSAPEPVSLEPEPMEQVPEPGEELSLAKPKPRTLRLIGTGLAVIVCISLVWFYANPFSNRPLALEKLNPQSVGLLPFDLNGSDERTAVLAKSLPASISDALSKVEGLTSGLGSADQSSTLGSIPIRERAEALHVRTLLSGSIQQVGNQVLIAFEWVDALDGTALWGKTYARTLGDHALPLIEKEMADTVARVCLNHFQLKVDERFARKLSYSPEALEAYGKGKHIVDMQNRTAMREAIRLFEEAIERDPNFAMAYVGLGYAYHLHRNTVEEEPLEDEDKRDAMKAAVEKALALNDQLPEAHLLEAKIKLKAGNRLGARASIDRALELDPHHAQAHYDLASWHFQGLSGPTQPGYSETMDEIFRLETKARELDPDNAAIHYGYVGSLEHQERWQEARDHYEEILERHPDFGRIHYELSSWHFYQGFSHVDAMVHLRKYLAIDPLIFEAPAAIAGLYRELGDYEEAARWTKILMAVDKDDAETYRLDLHWYSGDRELAIEGYRKYFRSNQKGSLTLYRRRLFNHYLRNGLFHEARNFYYFGSIDLFVAKPVIDGTFKAIMATEAAFILANTGEGEQAQRLMEASLDFFRTHKTKRFRLFYEVLYFLFQEDREQAVGVLKTMVENQGWRSRLNREDARLDSLREDPQFIALLQTVEDQIAEERDQIRQMEARGELEPIPAVILELEAESETIDETQQP